MSRGPREFNNYNLPIQARIPDPPAWLPPAALVEWRRITTELGSLAVLCALDVSALAQYSLLFSELQADPANFTAARHTQLRLVSAELGLSPNSRRRLMVLESPVDDDDDFQDLNDPQSRHKLFQE